MTTFSCHEFIIFRFHFKNDLWNLNNATCLHPPSTIFINKFHTKKPLRQTLCVFESLQRFESGV